MRLAESLNDEAGVKIAFQAILHNLFVIGEAVTELPADVRAQDPSIPWTELAGMRDLIGHPYPRMEPEVMHQTVQTDLEVLDLAVRRLQASAASARGSGSPRR